ncbi:MAG: HIT domain-containing protein [Candidatus Aenigmarchaeota archaeon]|nr:HIT domain-containing protein [Candidatus Aenigmarchaeota archaeon]
MEQKCIFCAIIAKQIPSYGIYEDENFMAFLDIRPLTKGHALVAPKKHHRWVHDVEDFGRYWEVAKKISSSTLSSLEPKYMQFITAGLEVPHAHIHVIPRYDEDGHPELPDLSHRLQLTEEEMKEMAEKLKSSIPQERIVAEEKPEPRKEPKWSDEELDIIKRELQRT